MSLKDLRVYILGNSNKHFMQIQELLEKKGMKIGLFTSIEDIIEQMQEQAPDYALLSVNHCSFGSVRRLLGVLQGSNIQCIPCGEVDNKETTDLLDELGMDQVLYPPLNFNKIINALEYQEKLKKRKSQEGIEQVSYKVGRNGEALPVNKIDYTDEQKEALAEQLIELQIEILESNLGDCDSSLDLGSDKLDLLGQAIDFETSYESLSPQSEIILENAMGSVTRFITEMGGQLAPRMDGTYLNSIEEFRAIYVNSSEISGYYFVAIEAGLSEEKRDELFKKAEAHLVETLNLNTDDHEIGAINLNVNNLDFCQWIDQNRGSLQSFILEDGTSLCWAFISSPRAELGIDPSVDENYFSARLDTVNPSVVLKNDIYLHFPFNGKFLLYTREGRFIEEKQYEKLQIKNVENIHFKKEDVVKFKNFKLESDVVSMLPSKKRAA